MITYSDLQKIADALRPFAELGSRFVPTALSRDDDAVWLEEDDGLTFGSFRRACAALSIVESALAGHQTDEWISAIEHLESKEFSITGTACHCLANGCALAAMAEKDTTDGHS